MVASSARIAEPRQAVPNPLLAGIEFQRALEHLPRPFAVANLLVAVAQRVQERRVRRPQGEGMLEPGQRLVALPPNVVGETHSLGDLDLVRVVRLDRKQQIERLVRFPR